MKIVIGISIVLLILGFAVNPGFLTLFLALLVLLGITWLTWLVLKGMVAIYRRFFPRDEGTAESDEGTTGMPKKTISFALKAVIFAFAFAFFYSEYSVLSVAPPREPDVFWKVPRLPAEARLFRIEKERIEKAWRIAEEKAEERARIEKGRIARIEKARRIAEEKAEERARIAEEKARQLKNEYSEYEKCALRARRLGYGVFDTIDKCAHLKRN